VGECIKAYVDMAAVIHYDPMKLDAVSAVRNLMLSAFARQMETIAKLPGRWRKEATRNMDISPIEAAEYCSQELEAALGSTPAVEPVPEVEADPYAELKAAWDAGRRIRCLTTKEDSWRRKGCEFPFLWTEPPEDYEIEPLPADKWAAEKAAHARGEKIESRCVRTFRCGSQDGVEWRFDPNPGWHDYCEYRIAPSPAPAGKLTDEQLGEIARKAVKAELPHSMIGDWNVTKGTGLFTFTRAVREAMEKEQSDQIEKLTQSATKAWEETDRARSKIAELTEGMGSLMEETPWGANNETQEQWMQRQREKANAQAEEIARLTEKTSEMIMLNAKQHAELERLRPRPISTPPTLADVNNDGRVILLGDGNSTHLSKITDWNDVHESWRRWLPLNLAAYSVQTAQEVERAEFERTMQTTFDGGWIHGLEKTPTGEYYVHESQVGFRIWQAARALKEVKA